MTQQKLGTGITATVSEDGKTLTLTLDISGPGELSASGKSMVVASTRGNKNIVTPDGTLTIGINAYRKA